MAAVQPRLSSTELPTKAPYDLRLPDVDLGFEQRRYVGRTLRTDRYASDR